MLIKDIILDGEETDVSRRTKQAADFINAVRQHAKVDPRVVADTISIYVSNKGLTDVDQAYSIAKARHGAPKSKDKDTKKSTASADMGWERPDNQKRRRGWTDKSHGHLRTKGPTELDLDKDISTNVKRGAELGKQVGTTIARIMKGTGPIKRGYDV